MVAPRKRINAKLTQSADGKIDLDTMLREKLSALSPSERTVATYMLDNIHLLAFETGNSLAEKVGVSVMTVSRLVRTLGFENLRDLKSRLRESVSDKGNEVDDYMGRFQTHDDRQQDLQESLRLELDGIVKAYELAGTDLWREATTLVADTPTIFVVGFQASRGLARDFASRLLWVRQNVVFVENATGTYGEILSADPGRCLVVLIDTAAYATQGVKLAELLDKLNFPLVIVTDKFSHWAFSYTRLVFEVHTHVKTFWDSTASLSVALNLMIDAVATRLGAKALNNFARMSEFSNVFGEFVGGSYLQRKD